MSTPLHACPCCRELTISSPANFEICSRCGWEDDGQSDADADVVRGGPNGLLSLTQARLNFIQRASQPERGLFRVTLYAVPEQPGAHEGAYALAFVEAANAQEAYAAVEWELRALDWLVEEPESAALVQAATLASDEREFYEEAQREKFVLVMNTWP